MPTDQTQASPLSRWLNDILQHRSCPKRFSTASTPTCKDPILLALELGAPLPTEQQLSKRLIERETCLRVLGLYFIYDAIHDCASQEHSGVRPIEIAPFQREKFAATETSRNGKGNHRA